MKKEEIKRLTLTVTVEYTANSPQTEEVETENVISLAISPNFGTKGGRISLESVIAEDPHGIKRTRKRGAELYGVFPIVNGCSQDCVYSGIQEECISYGKEHFKGEDYIILEL